MKRFLVCPPCYNEEREGLGLYRRLATLRERNQDKNTRRAPIKCAYSASPERTNYGQNPDWIPVSTLRIRVRTDQDKRALQRIKHGVVLAEWPRDD